MIDWLRRAPEDARVAVGDRELPVVVTRNARARRLTVRLSADGSAVRVTLPRWCPEREALAFVHARTGWLAEQLARVPPPRPPEAGGTLAFRGQELAIEWRKDAPRRPRVEGATLILGGPAERLDARLRRWLEGEALHLMQDDVAFFAERAAVALPHLRLSRAKRRWGSCSSGGTVRINWRLVQAPDAVRRSVVAHEIAHCRHFDHSAAFHRLLAEIFDDDLPAADRWLKQHGRMLYSAFG